MSVPIDVLEIHLDEVKDAIEAQREAHANLTDSQVSYDQAKRKTQEQVDELKSVLTDVN